MHTNEGIWLVLERAWLEYRSRLTWHNIETRPFRYFNCIFLPFIDTFYEKYGRKHHGINTRLVGRKFRRFSTKHRRIRKLSRFATVSNETIKLLYKLEFEIDYVFPCVCTVIIHRYKTPERTKSHHRTHRTRLRLVPYFLVLYTLWRHLCIITIHTHGKT